MVSKRQKREWRKFLQQQAGVMDLELKDLMISDIKFDRKVRNKALRMARKREKQAESMVV